MQLESPYEAEAARRLPEILEEALELPHGSVAVERQPGRGRPDLLIRFNEAPALVAEVKGSSRSVDVEQAARLARAAASEVQGVPLVVVPYMGKAGQQVARGAGVGWIDLSGNANLRAGNIVLRIAGMPNRYAGPGRPASPFAPVSSRIARLLLLDPPRWWRQVELAREADMRDGHVSKVVGRLAEMELIERRSDRALRPNDPYRLLDAWAEDYDFRKHSLVWGHLTGGGPELARDLDAELRRANSGHAFTGLPAAWLRDRFARFRLISIYVGRDAVQLGEELGMRPERRGANVQLIRPNDPGVFAGSDEVDGIRCVSIVQTYLDLLGLPERAHEAAEHLRAQKLNWSRSDS